jgi:predicted ATPase with chaperone activity
LRDAALEDAVGTSDDIRHAVEDVLRIHSMSGRARVRLLRIARTIADLDDRDNVLIPDIHAAARLRGYGSII